MKTVLQIPDELMRRVKIHAAMTNQKLRYLFEHWIERGVAADEKSGALVPISGALKKGRARSVTKKRSAASRRRPKER